MEENFVSNPKMRDMCSRVKLEKIHDKVFGDDHPNGINTGSVREGWMFRSPKVGEAMWLFPGKMMKLGIILSAFRTSFVTEIQDGGVIHTENSIYTALIEVCNSEGHPHWKPLTPEILLEAKA